MMEIDKIIKTNEALGAVYNRLQELIAGLRLSSVGGFADKLNTLDKPMSKEAFEELQVKCLETAVLDTLQVLGEMLQLIPRLDKEEAQHE